MSSLKYYRWGEGGSETPLSGDVRGRRSVSLGVERIPRALATTDTLSAPLPAPRVRPRSRAKPGGVSVRHPADEVTMARELALTVAGHSKTR